MGNLIVEHSLPDGSTAVVKHIGCRSVLISREVGAQCVWGQAYSSGTDEAFASQVSGVVESMRQDPSAFERDCWCVICGSAAHTYREHVA